MGPRIAVVTRSAAIESEVSIHKRPATAPVRSPLMAGCPTCGGLQREPISPGWWRCTSLITETFEGPGSWNPQIGLPKAVQQQRPCDTTYVEPDAATPSLPACACGTFAVGMCTRCSTPVCGTHSGIIGGERLCYADYHAAQVAAEDAAAAAAARTEEERQARHHQALAAWADTHRESIAALTPIERGVVVWAAVGALPVRGQPGRRQDAGDAAALLEVPRPTVDEALDWFVAAPKSEPDWSIRYTRRTVLGGYKDVRPKAWGLLALTTSTSRVIHGDTVTSIDNLAVTTDGRVWTALGSAWQEGRPSKPTNFSAEAFGKMATYVGLTVRLPAPPALHRGSVFPV